VPKAADGEIQHHGEGTTHHTSKLTARLSPIFDKLWIMGSDARTCATGIENALTERGLISLSQRKHDPKKHLRDLQAKASKAKPPKLAEAWKPFQAAFDAASEAEIATFESVAIDGVSLRVIYGAPRLDVAWKPFAEAWNDATKKERSEFIANNAAGKSLLALVEHERDRGAPGGSGREIHRTVQPDPQKAQEHVEPPVAAAPAPPQATEATEAANG